MKAVAEETVCFHCGLPCVEEVIKRAEKTFCCHGCELVFDLIEENNLCQYYNIEAYPGLKRTNTTDLNYEYLCEPEIRKRLLEFDSDDFARVTFQVPSIHCSSCIWLLESLQKVHPGVLRSEVNFGQKTVSIEFQPNRTDLARLATLLDAFGYPPQIAKSNETPRRKTNTDLVLRLAVAGFAFGNVMLFSFPEYLGLDPEDHNLGRIFSWLNFILSLPVLLFSATDYFKSALKSARQKQINVDVPIALGLLALFFRSTYDIVTQTGPGYLDSFTGLVFFLLIGRWIQSRTYESLSFERDFKSYFPIAVQRISGAESKPVAIFDLMKGDQIRIRNLEIIPADCILNSDADCIDYSFVTGESKPVSAQAGDLVYAGGRVIGQPVLMTVDKETSQSHLTSLWNRDAFRKRHETRYRRIIDRAARVFSWSVLVLAGATAIFWYYHSPSQMWLVLTAVLMVACPCALALAAPFTFGSTMRQFGRRGFYLKNADVVERLSVIDTVVFDKTGTVTHGEKPKIIFHGQLDDDEIAGVKLLTGFSTHPLSKLVHDSIGGEALATPADFRELPGRGIEGCLGGRRYKIGSAKFAAYKGVTPDSASAVFVSIDGEVKGFFLIKTSIRRGIQAMLQKLGRRSIAMLSGDSKTEEIAMTGVFPPNAKLLFNQQPSDKMDHVCSLQDQGMHVLMIGDGLNDAGALKQADVGIAVTDDTGLFTPGSDGILQGGQLQNLDKFLTLARKSTAILKIAFAISFAYNLVSLVIAVTGNLTPLVAAVLMPVSSISVVGFSTLAVRTVSSRLFRKS